MSRSIAFPFLVLSDEAIKSSGWRIAIGDGELTPCGVALEGWDYSTAIRAEIDIDCDWPVVSQCLGLEKAAFDLTAVAWWSTGPGAMPLRHIGQRAIWMPGRPLALGMRIPGHQLSGKVRLELELFCSAEGIVGHPLAPGIAMARVWSCESEVLLEGGGASRFPLEARSFNEDFHNQTNRLAPWHLFWQSGVPDADFSSAVRLWVNADMPAFMERFMAGDPLTVQVVLGNVMEQIVAGTLDSGDFVMDGDYGDGSVGAQVRHWISSAFPGLDLDQVRNILRQDRGRFASALLATAAQGDRA
jgi:hypothetical protein